MRTVVAGLPIQLGAWVLVLIVGACRPLDDVAFEFALLGDNPYGPQNVPRFRALVDDINHNGGLEWVLHLGDIKGGEERCSDELLEGRFDLYQGFRAPFIYTPGDNDWFDCADEEAGAFDEYERLRHLRRLFFPWPGSTTGGSSISVRSQSAEPGFEQFVENVMWVRGGVVFSTFHLIALTREPKDAPAAELRMDAALHWIAKTFRHAREIDGAGVFLATQVDPWVVSGSRSFMRRLCRECLEPRKGMERLYPVLVKESLEFAGPVFMAVGDTHVFRVDKPLYSRETGRLVDNFTRVEVFGDPSVHWVRVTVDPTQRSVFSVRQEIVKVNEAPGSSR